MSKTLYLIIVLTEAPNPLAVSTTLCLSVILIEAPNLLTVSKILYLNLLSGHWLHILGLVLCVMTT